MSYTSERVNGAADQVGGRFKRAVGGLFGNDRLKAEGVFQQYRGSVTVAAAKVAQRLLGQVEQLLGSLKKGLGAIIDNDQLRVQGLADQAKGKARDVASQ